MKHKTMLKIAVVVLIIFVGTIVVYPLIFGPSSSVAQEPLVPTSEAPSAN